MSKSNCNQLFKEFVRRIESMKKEFSSAGCCDRVPATSEAIINNKKTLDFIYKSMPDPNKKLPLSSHLFGMSCIDRMICMSFDCIKIGFFTASNDDDRLATLSSGIPRLHYLATEKIKRMSK